MLKQNKFNSATVNNFSTVKIAPGGCCCCCTCTCCCCVNIGVNTGGGDNTGSTDGGNQN